MHLRHEDIRLPLRAAPLAHLLVPGRIKASKDGLDAGTPIVLPSRPEAWMVQGSFANLFDYGDLPSWGPMFSKTADRDFVRPFLGAYSGCGGENKNTRYQSIATGPSWGTIVVALVHA